MYLWEPNYYTRKIRGLELPEITQRVNRGKHVTGGNVLGGVKPACIITFERRVLFCYVDLHSRLIIPLSGVGGTMQNVLIGGIPRAFCIYVSE